MKRQGRDYLIGLVLIGSIAGTGYYYYYQSKCHGMDACAAQSAESHERDSPLETR